MLIAIFVLLILDFHNKFGSKCGWVRQVVFDLVVCNYY